MLRSFNATIDADIAESKLTTRMIQKGQIQIKKDNFDSIQLQKSLDQDSSHIKSGTNTSGLVEEDASHSYDSIEGARGKRNH